MEGGDGRDSMCDDDFELIGDLYNNVSSFYFSDYITMGFKNKKSRSKLGNPGGSGRPAGEFSELDEQEKRDYFNDTVHKHRSRWTILCPYAQTSTSPCLAKLLNPLLGRYL